MNLENPLWRRCYLHLRWYFLGPWGPFGTLLGINNMTMLDVPIIAMYWWKVEFKRYRKSYTYGNFLGSSKWYCWGIWFDDPQFLSSLISCQLKVQSWNFDLCFFQKAVCCPWSNFLIFFRLIKNIVRILWL